MRMSFPLAWKCRATRPELFRCDCACEGNRCTTDFEEQWHDRVDSRTATMENRRRRCAPALYSSFGHLASLGLKGDGPTWLWQLIETPVNKRLMIRRIRPAHNAVSSRIAILERNLDRLTYWVLVHSMADQDAADREKGLVMSSRRQQVIPEPQPISWGSISQGMPDIETKTMPPRHARSGRRRRPGWRHRRRLTGMYGSISAHSSSVTSG